MGEIPGMRQFVRPNEKLSGNATALRRQAKREGVAAVAFPLERRVRPHAEFARGGGKRVDTNKWEKNYCSCEMKTTEF